MKIFFKKKILILYLHVILDKYEAKICLCFTDTRCFLLSTVLRRQTGRRQWLCWRWLVQKRTSTNWDLPRCFPGHPCDWGETHTVYIRVYTSYICACGRYFSRSFFIRSWRRSGAALRRGLPSPSRGTLEASSAGGTSSSSNRKRSSSKVIFGDTRPGTERWQGAVDGGLL